jgi:two-component system sensor histidine kinase HydH
VFDEGMLARSTENRFGRYTIPDRRGRSAKFVLYYGKMPPNAGPPPHERPRPDWDDHDDTRRGEAGRRENGGEREDREGQPFMFRQERRQEQGPLFFGARGRYFFTNISHAAYWRARTLTAALFPLVEIILLLLVCYIRRLYLRNLEYREKIDAQQNLVVLGTAAGTLAHEIKNPLLSIRLQTGILEKIAGENGRDEIGIINQEVDRLSALIYRVNDYLRESEGEKAPLNITALLRETSQRLCGVDIVAGSSKADSKADGDDAVILADENRIRSVLENVIRNALDSGSPPDGIGASVDIEGGRSVVIRIVDRGRGIAETDLKRVFDPFFTTKSTGTGIGLAISKRFTEAAGGTISVANRITDGGTGLEVTIQFPLYNKEKA